MKESLSNAFILNIIIVFFAIFTILFAGSTAYTKAFKVKNRIVSIIEKNEDIVIAGGITKEVVTEIESALSEAGYTIVTNNDQKCSSAMKERFKNNNYDFRTINTGTNTYRYCIVEFNNNSTMEGKYYAVVAYMYFEVPLIGRKLEFPVFGETKVMGISY